MYNYFKLYACCLLVKGSVRSIICDVQRHSFDFIPNDMLDLLEKYKSSSFSEILENCGEDNHAIIEDYFAFLVKNEYGFWCSENEIELFPSMSLEWDNPYEITNVIIDIEDKTPNFKDIIKQLTNLGNVDIQIRCFKTKNIDFFIQMLDLFEFQRIKSIHIITPYNVEIGENEWAELCHKYLRIFSITIHSAPFDRILETKLIKTNEINFISQNISSASHCGIITPNYFVANIPLFTESQKHNTCLNRKISIDVNGEIKNCPSMAKSYGNIKDTTLVQALEKQGFKDVWYIHKDQISVCKDCEFRHICTDCRAYIQDPNDILSKPAKCSYDPYTATWGEENLTQNPLHSN